jgi:hypothetical protein
MLIDAKARVVSIVFGHNKSNAFTNLPDSAVKGTRSKAKSLANVLEEEVPLDFPFHRDFEHARRDVHTDPVVTVLVENLAAQSRTATNVQQELCLIISQRE